MCDETVTVCIPAYNAEKYIRTTIESILDQTYKNIKVIVCDNASSDNTKGVVESISDERIEYRRFKEYLDVNYSMVRSIKQGETDLICMFHADDWYYPTIIEDYIRYIRNIKGVGAVFSKTHSIISGDITNMKENQPHMLRVYDYEKYLNAAMLKGTIFHAPTMMIRRDIAQRAFSKDVEYISDMNIWLQILKKTLVLDIQDTYCNHREGSKLAQNLTKRMTVGPQFIVIDSELNSNKKSINKINYIKYNVRKRKELIGVIRNRIRNKMSIKSYVVCCLGIKRLGAKYLEGNLDNYKNILYGKL